MVLLKGSSRIGAEMLDRPILEQAAKIGTKVEGVILKINFN